MFIRRLKDCPEFLAGDHTILRQLFHPENHPVEIRYSIAHATVRPGERSLRHALTSTEVYYILEGEGEMQIDAETEQVSPGDIIYIPPRAVQSILNTGTTNLVFLCMVDPAWREDDEIIL